jgi:hypothetical protein
MIGTVTVASPLLSVLKKVELVYGSKPISVESIKGITDGIEEALHE